MPYFFTDQYDLGMEYVGTSARTATTGWTSTATSVPARLVPGLLGQGRPVVAALHVNDWDAPTPSGRASAPAADRPGNRRPGGDNRRGRARCPDPDNTRTAVRRWGRPLRKA